MRSLNGFLFIILAAPFAFAGQSVSNGGDVVHCLNKDGSTKSVELLDIFEARHRVKDYTLSLEGESYLDRARSGLARLERLDIGRFDVFSHYLSRFQSDVELTNRELVDISDTEHLFKPPTNCKIEQIAIHTKPIGDQPRYYINKKLWSFLDANNKATLVLHEIISRDFFERGETNSRLARHLTSWIVSRAIEDVTLQEYLDFKFVNNMPTFYIGSTKYPNIYVERPTPRHKKWRGYRVANDKVSKFAYNRKTYFVQPGSLVQFYENGNIEEVALRDGQAIKTMLLGEEVTLIERLRFHKEGEISGGIVGWRPIRTNIGGQSVSLSGFVDTWKKIWRRGELASPTTLFVGQNAKKYTFKGSVRFYPSGELKRGPLANEQVFKIAGQEFTIPSSLVEFYKNGSPKRFRISELTVSMEGQNLSLGMGPRSHLELHKNGMLSSALVSKSFRGRFVYQSNDSIIEPGRVKWNKKGEIVMAWLLKPQTVRLNENNTHRVQSLLSFSNNTDHRSTFATLVDETIVKFPSGQLKMKGIIALYEDGSLREGTIASPTKMRIFGEEKQVVGSVRFYPENKPFLISYKNAQICSFGKISYECDQVVYDREGNITQLSTTENVTAQNIDGNTINLNSEYSYLVDKFGRIIEERSLPKSIHISEYWN